MTLPGNMKPIFDTDYPVVTVLPPDRRPPRGPGPTIDRRRPRASEVAEMQLVGEVRDSSALLVDDMTDTAGTITEAAKVVMNAGATGSAGLRDPSDLSDPACESLNKSNIKEMTTTNTIPLRAKAQAELGSLKVLSVASLIAEGIRRIHNEESMSLALHLRNRVSRFRLDLYRTNLPRMIYADT